MSCDLAFKAGSLILLANGQRKAEAVVRSVLEQASPEVPVSYSQIYVQKGGDLTYVIDEAAARDLLKEKAALNGTGIQLKDLRKK